MSVTVYSRENCVQCKQTYMFLDKFGIDYSRIDIDQDKNAAAVIDKYDFQSAPVVIVENSDGDNTVSDAWCGFRIDKIKELQKASVNA
ncbi:MAG: glutaredoxin family protein [Candidatus Ancillula sp.]|jgi:glutaredoxin-like protein NrdH|nr:glutaredoxin family protein [Candidatus Ancillula sp.]